MARDPYGFRPLAMGQLEHCEERHAYVFASETCAFDLIDAEYMGDVQPGEMVIAGPNGITREQWTAPRNRQAQCVFEHVYFSRPDSIVFGRSVQESRENDGARCWHGNIRSMLILWFLFPTRVFPPRLGYSKESGIPFGHALIRNHYVGRTFIEPSQAIRDFGVKLKLNPIRRMLEGKRVVLVDDSLVRGTTSANWSVWSGMPARPKSTCGFRARRRCRPVSTASTRLRRRN